MTLRAMVEPALELLSREVVYPLTDRKNGSSRLREAAELRASQWWTRRELDRHRDERLSRMLDHARKTVPFYRDHWGERDLPRSAFELPQLPLVRKSHLRGAAASMVSDEFDRGSLLTAKTGGSTGTSLLMYFDDPCQQSRNAAAIRSDEWAGWRIGASIAALWGNPPKPAGLRAGLRASLHQRILYCDTMLLNDEVVRDFAAQMIRTGTRFLFGHAHSIYRFCESLDRQGGPVPRVEGIVSTSMMLLQPERELIERVLSCRVSDRYGCEEVGLIASECGAHDGYHINEEHVVVEIVGDDGRPVPAGQPGLVCVTDLINRAMPLIRYVVEDVAVARAEPCGCGRAHARIGTIVGRTADFLKRADGGLVAGVSLVERTLTHIPGLAQLQLVQDRVDHLTANVVGDSRFGPETMAALIAELRLSLGSSLEVSVVPGDSLPQEANGKYRFAICRC